jgi:LmbE family N-acetylglucosaminyl deacetylase
MGEERRRLLIVGAHPDDADIRAGGVAALAAQRGDEVLMVSLTNGDAGHHEMGGAPLAWRRRQEAAQAGACLGARYITQDHHDGELQPTLALRREVVRLIRQFAPQLILGPRPWDYHPDHRAAGELLIDALYMTTVPNFCSDAPHLRHMPVLAYVYDGFERPCPFAPDVLVDIDSVMPRKLDALACHASQVYEWLPYNREALDEVPTDPAERRQWLGSWYEQRFSGQAERYRQLLIARYGPERGRAVRFAEAFEVSEYGATPSPEERDALWPH